VGRRIESILEAEKLKEFKKEKDRKFLQFLKKDCKQMGQ
jgi:hypothetical protein